MTLHPFLAKGCLLLAVLFGAAAGCEQQTGSNSQSTGKTKQVTVEVTGMACPEGCAPRAREALASLPWAKDVRVDFPRNQATFVAEAERYDEEAIVRVLKDAGFGGKVVP